ncbi:MAG: hypothetical protein J6L81_04465 [Clostridia bacterium]|nr:hypothetical protein [Clostridia bacterium]
MLVFNSLAAAFFSMTAMVGFVIFAVFRFNSSKKNEFIPSTVMAAFISIYFWLCHETFLQYRWSDIPIEDSGSGNWFTIFVCMECLSHIAMLFFIVAIGGVILPIFMIKAIANRRKFNSWYYLASVGISLASLILPAVVLVYIYGEETYPYIYEYNTENMIAVFLPVLFVSMFLAIVISVIFCVIQLAKVKERKLSDTAAVSVLCAAAGLFIIAAANIMIYELGYYSDCPCELEENIEIARFSSIIGICVTAVTGILWAATKVSGLVRKVKKSKGSKDDKA